MPLPAPTEPSSPSGQPARGVAAAARRGAGRNLDVPPELHPLARTALLLERLERQPRGAGSASADQYRRVVQQVASLLQQAPAGPALQALLDFFPATGELYENLHYEQAGLCRSNLDVALPAELSAAAALRSIARRR